MQHWENLEAGNKIELIPPSQVRSGNIYFSKIQDIFENGEMEILMPIEQGKMILLPVGSRYIVSFYTKSGIFQGDCVVVKRYRDKHMFYLVIRLTSRLTKKQRREYYRLECNQEIGFRIMNGQEALIREKIRNDSFETPEEKETYVNEILDLDLTSEWIPAVMLDISGGGVRIKTQKQDDLEKHLMLRLNLYIEGDIKQLDLECYVVSRSDIVDETRMMELRCQYIHITNQKQEMIVRYIFDQQRKQRSLT